MKQFVFYQLNGSISRIFNSSSEICIDIRKIQLAFFIKKILRKAFILTNKKTNPSLFLF